MDHPHVSDCYLTVRFARGFKRLGTFQFERGFELTLQFQQDINNLRPFSRLHVTLLTLYSLLILALWYVIVSFMGWDRLFLMCLGLFLLLEAVVDLWHFRDLFLIREIEKHGGVVGQFSYRKWFSYRLSAFELTLYFALFLNVAILTYSSFLSGGSMMYSGNAKHCRLA